MSSLFDDLWASAQPAFDGPMGEPVLVTPQVTKTRASRYVAGGADPANPAFTVVGIYRSEVVPTRVMGSGANSHENADVLVGKTTMDFDAAQFTAATRPVEDWHITLTTRPGAPAFRIASIKPDEVARVVCVLTPEVRVPQVSAP